MDTVLFFKIKQPSTIKIQRRKARTFEKWLSTSWPHQLPKKTWGETVHILQSSSVYWVWRDILGAKIVEATMHRAQELSCATVGSWWAKRGQQDLPFSKALAASLEVQLEPTLVRLTSERNAEESSKDPGQRFGYLWKSFLLPNLLFPG